jgi:NADH:ubiquinone oxidoreductase subunit B-like Fe-S oxidoreductase
VHELVAEALEVGGHDHPRHGFEVSPRQAAIFLVPSLVGAVAAAAVRGMVEQLAHPAPFGWSTCGEKGEMEGRGTACPPG